MPQNREQIEKKSDAPQQRADSPSAKVPAVEAQHRVALLMKRVDGMRSTIAQRDAGPASLNQRLDDAGMRIVRSIEERANALRDMAVTAVGDNVDHVRANAGEALSFVVDTLRSQPALAANPTSSLVDSLVKIGKANRDSVDPKVQAEVEELRALVRQMQEQLKKQPEPVASAVPTVVINNNLGSQVGSDAREPSAPEKKVEQQGWQQEGLGLMKEVASINKRIALLKREYAQRSGSDDDPVAKKTFRDEVDGLITQRMQLLRTVNALVENARNPSQDRNQVAATREESSLEMNKWLNAMGQYRGGLVVVNGAFRVM